MDRIIRASALVIEDGKLLAVRNNFSPLYLMPGGKVKPGETELQALGREVMEETCTKVSGAEKFREYDVEKALFQDKPMTIVTYFTKIEGVPSPGHEIVDVVWLGPDNYNNYKLAPTFGGMIVPDLVKEGFLNFRL